MNAEDITWRIIEIGVLALNIPLLVVIARGFTRSIDLKFNAMQEKFKELSDTMGRAVQEVGRKVEIAMEKIHGLDPRMALIEERLRALDDETKGLRRRVHQHGNILARMGADHRRQDDDPQEGD